MNNTVAAVILLYTKILGEGVMLSSIHSSMAKRFCANIPTRLTEIMVQRGSVPKILYPGRKNEQYFPIYIPRNMALGLSAKKKKPESLFPVYGNSPHIIRKPDLMDKGVRQFQPTVLNPVFYRQTSKTSGSSVLRFETDITIPECFESMDAVAREKLIIANSIARVSNLGGTIEETMSKLGKAKPSEIKELIELILNGRAGVVKKFTVEDEKKIEEFYQGFNLLVAAKQAGVEEAGMRILETLIKMHVPQKYILSDKEARLMYNVFDVLIPDMVTARGTLLSTTLQASVLRNIGRDFFRASMLNKEAARTLAIMEPNRGFLELIRMQAERLPGQLFSEVLTGIQERSLKTRESYNSMFQVDDKQVSAIAYDIRQYQAIPEEQHVGHPTV